MNISNIPISNPIFYYGDGEMRIKANGTIAAIEIFFRGKPELTSVFPQGGLYKKGSRKIIIVNIGDVFDEEQILFTYSGYFKPLRVTVVDWDRKKYRATMIPENIHFWTFLNGTWETLTKNWENLSKGYIS